MSSPPFAGKPCPRLPQGDVSGGAPLHGASSVFLDGAANANTCSCKSLDSSVGLSLSTGQCRETVEHTSWVPPVLALSCRGEFLLRGLFYSLLASACSLQTQTITEEDEGRLLFLLIRPTPYCLFALEEHLSPQALCAHASCALCFSAERMGDMEGRSMEQTAWKGASNEAFPEQYSSSSTMLPVHPGLSPGLLPGVGGSVYA